MRAHRYRLTLQRCTAALLGGVLLTLNACTEPAPSSVNKDASYVDLSKRAKPSAIINKPWDAALISARNPESLASLFVQIGDYDSVSDGKGGLILTAKGADNSRVHILKNNNPDAAPIRPADSRSWDKGCYFSVMMRAKDIASIIEDAMALGWQPLTEIAYLEFGPSTLNIVVLTHKETGVKIQIYERLTTALPEGFTPFKRLSRPFNIMQMSKDRDVAYDFFQQKLGMETFFYGPPYLSEEAEVMPLGIPPKFTISAAYKTAILTPFKGAEWGRLELIDIDPTLIDGDPSLDLSSRCSGENEGLFAVEYITPDMEALRKDLKARKIVSTPLADGGIAIKSPDGSNMHFVKPR